MTLSTPTATCKYSRDLRRALEAFQCSVYSATDCNTFPDFLGEELDDIIHDLGEKLGAIEYTWYTMVLTVHVAL